MNKYLRNFLYIIPVLFLGFSLFLSNRTNAQSNYWPWVDLAYPGYATNITSNSATLNGTLSFSNATNASNLTTQVWFEYYKWYGSYDTQKIATTKQTITYNGGQEYPRFTFTADATSLEPNTNYCVQSKATNSAGTAESTALCFKTLASGSTDGTTGETTSSFQVATKGVGSYSNTWANLQGEITSMTGASSVDYYFIYRKEGDTATKATGIYKKTTTGVFEIQVSDLIANTRYCFRAVGKNSANYNQISEGSEVCFTTGSSTTSSNLEAQTKNTSEYGMNWATFKGEIIRMTNISKVDYYFSYRKDGGTWQATGVYQTTNTGAISVQANNLDSNAKYCYKAIARDYYNPSVISEGSEICFTTGQTGNSNNYGLNVNTLPYDYIADTYAILRGEITNMGNASKISYWFEYYKTGSGANTTNADVKTSIGGFTNTIYNLTPDTLYCYKAIGANTNNSSEWDAGTEHCFRTLKSGQNNTNTGNYSYTICYKKILIYVNYDSSWKKNYYTKGIGTNNADSIQYFSSEETVKDYINQQSVAYNQCSSGDSSNNQNASATKKYFYYCQNSTGKCVQTNSQYESNTNCEYSLKTYLPGISTNVCFTTTAECSKYCRQSSSGSSNSSGSGNYQANKYYYCRIADKKCVETDGKYANTTICSQALNIYKPGISSGICFETNDTCTKACGSATSNQQIQEPSVKCANNETKLEVSEFSDIQDTSRQFNGKIICVSDKNTVVGFEYYGKSETAKEPKIIWLEDAKPMVGQELSFSKKIENLEAGTIYCYKTIAKITAGQTYYSQNEICYPDKQLTIDDCKVVFEQYITEPFNGVNDELYVALKENCPIDMYVPGIADKEKGFPNDIADMQDSYTKEKDSVSAQLKKAVSRSGFAKFFVGANYKAIKAVEKFVENNKARIEEVNKLSRDYKSQYSEMAIERISKLLEKENQEITDSLAKAKKGFSLFGWLFKIFS